MDVGVYSTGCDIGTLGIEDLGLWLSRQRVPKSDDIAIFNPDLDFGVEDLCGCDLGIY